MKIENISAELIDHMGSDVSVVNAARVSFGKAIEELTERDKKLIKYLAKNKHWSPFAHTSIQLRCAAPIFCARQFVKHQVGGVWNEESRRYIDEEPSFYVPEHTHSRPDGSIKQGSGLAFEEPDNGWFIGDIRGNSLGCLQAYNYLLANGLAPEEARMVLPLNTMTHWVWTGSLYFWARVYKLRSDSHAQLAAQEFASHINNICSKLYPVSWEALTTFDLE